MSDLILYHGFHSIFFNNTYNKDKALNLVKSGHVTHVKEVKTIQGPCLISGQVIRQASVTLAPYNVKIEVSSVIIWCRYINSELYLLILNFNSCMTQG